MPTIAELGQKVKAKHPGAYDDMSDADVGRAVKAKFPGAYDDFADEAATAPAASPVGTGEAFMQGLGRGAHAIPALLSGGLIDNARTNAAIEWLRRKMAGDPAAFSEIEKAIRAREQQGEKEHPIASGIGVGIGSTPALMAVPQARLAQGAGLATRALVGGGQAAAEAGATQYGADSGMDTGDRVQRALLAAATAAPVGAATRMLLPAAPVPNMSAGLAPKPRLAVTPAAERLRSEGVEGLTVGQMAPQSTLGVMERASEANPLGMGPARKAAEESFMRVAQDKGLAPGAKAPLTTDLQGRLREIYKGFEPAYAPIREQSVPSALVDDMANVAGKLPEGIDARTTGRVADEVRNALTVLPQGRGPGSVLSAGGAGTKAVQVPGIGETKIPAWIDPQDFLANRQAWEWTWAATGADAPEGVQQLVHGYMRKAFGGGDADFGFGANANTPNDFALKQAYAAARLAQGKGGAKFEGLRQLLRKWMERNPAERPDDPITAIGGDAVWGKLIDTTRRDTEWVGHGKYVDPKKIDVMSRWLAETKSQLDPATRLYNAEGGGAPASSPFKVGDLMKVRENLREQIRAATQSQDFDRIRQLEHAEDVVTRTIDEALPEDLAKQLRATDRQYARLMVAERAAPAGQTKFTPGQYLRAVERSSGRRAFKQGGAGDLQDLGEAAREVFEPLPMTGVRPGILSWIPAGKVLGAPMSRLANSEAGRRFLLTPRPVPQPGAPMSPVPYYGSAATAAPPGLEELLAALLGRPRVGLVPAGANEEAPR